MIEGNLKFAVGVGKLQGTTEVLLYKGGGVRRADVVGRILQSAGSQ